jgi:hypothetical protein
MTKQTFITLPITIEQYDREQFHREGHTLFGLYGPGDTPEDLPIRRQWTGDNVFIASMVIDDRKLLRVMSDSELGAQTALMDRAKDGIAGTVRVQEIREFNYQQFLTLNDERNRLAEFIQQSYGAELERRENQNVCDVAIHYLRIERGRWAVRLRQMFQKRRAK